MAGAVASGIPLVLSASVKVSSCHDKQASAAGVHGAVTGFLRVKSTRGHPLTATIKRRKALNLPSTFVRNEATAGDKKNTFKTAAGAGSADDSERGDSANGDATKPSSVLQRRELLWAATGTLSYVSSAGHVQAAPVPPGDMDSSTCRTVPTETAPGTQICCLPDGKGLEVYPFQFEDLPMRVRKPAHILSQDLDYVKKYNDAYRLMNDLPGDDPRSFLNQWHVHCAFCEGVYPEPGNKAGLPLQYHKSWTFLPWHRMFLYFHERILGELIQDHSFALPVWNWADQSADDGANLMPFMFTGTYTDPTVDNSYLQDSARNKEHYPPAIIDLQYSRTGPPHDPDINANLSILHKAMVAAGSSTAFLGEAYRANQPTENPGTSQGSLEMQLHNIVHIWTGPNDTQKYPDYQDMGIFTFAGRDPIFFSHHANVDRLWTVWTTLPDVSTRSGTRKREDPKDPDFLNTEFAFYDHLKRLVHVKVQDTLNPSLLCYEYMDEPSDDLWKNFTPKPSGFPKPSLPDIAQFSQTITILSKDESASFALERAEPTDDLEEVLLVKGVKVPNSYMAFRVYINLPDADTDTRLDIQEFAGIITYIPHLMTEGSHSGHDGRGLNFRLSIRETLASLDIPSNETVAVTFVPQSVEEDVSFEEVTVEWL